MFDTGDALPRQGAAIFVDEIRSRIAARIKTARLPRPLSTNLVTP